MHNHATTTSTRRLLISLAAGALVLGACGSDDADDDADVAAETNTATEGDEAISGTLTFWSNLEGGQLEWFNGFVAEFETAHPDVDIETTQISTEEYWAKLIAAFAAGEPPDVFTNPSGELFDRHARAGQLGNLDGMIDEANFNPAALDNLRSTDGELYGIPNQQFAIVMWGNGSVMAEHGVEPPTSWDELLDACRVLADAGVAPISLGNGGQDQWTAQFLMEVLAYQYGGPDVFTDATFERGGASWADEPFVQAATALDSLVDADCFPRGFNGLNYSQMQSMFLQDEAAMMFMGSWFAAQLNTIDDASDVTVFAFPDAPDAQHSTQSYEILLGGVTGWAASKDAVEGNPDLVAAFFNAYGAAADESANANSVLSVAADPTPSGGPTQTAMTEMLTSADQLVRVMDNVTPSAIHAPYFQNVFELTSGDLSPEEWANAMAEAVERERAEFEDLGS